MKWYFVLNEQADESYKEAAKIAVLSCKEKTTLLPHLVWDGESCVFTDWMESRGVLVIRSHVPFLDALEASRGKRGLRPEAARGAYLRVQIPVIETEDEYVLYTDCDVLFVSDPTDYLSTLTPRFISATVETYRDEKHFFNSGVMLINVPNMRSDYDDFCGYISENLPNWLGFSANDQGALNNFYRGLWDHISPSINWKPYWGEGNSDTSIVHFHGARPPEVTRFLAGRFTVERATAFANAKNLPSLARYCALYGRYITQAYERTTTIIGASLTGRRLDLILDIGDDARVHRSLEVEIEFEGAILKRYLNIPDQRTGEYRTRFVIDAMPQAASCRVRLGMRDENWTAVDRCARDDDFQIVAHVLEPNQPTLGFQVRVSTIKQVAFRTRYVHLQACKKAVLTDSSVDFLSVNEDELPKHVVVNWKVLDVETAAFVRPDLGISLSSDQTCDQYTIKIMAKNTSDDFQRRHIARLEHDAVAFIPMAVGQSYTFALLICFPHTSLSEWLGGTISRLSMFRHASLPEGPYLVGRLDQDKRTLIASLGLRSDQLIEVDDEQLQVDKLYVASGPGLTLPVMDRSWPETIMTPPCQPESSPDVAVTGDGVICIVSSTYLESPIHKALLACFAEYGLPIVILEEKIADAVEAISSARVIIALDDAVAPFLIFSRRNAAIVELQMSETFVATNNLQFAVTKSLAYAVVSTGGNNLDSHAASLATELLRSSDGLNRMVSRAAVRGPNMNDLEIGLAGSTRNPLRTIRRGFRPNTRISAIEMQKDLVEIEDAIVETSDVVFSRLRKEFELLKLSDPDRARSFDFGFGNAQNELGEDGDIHPQAPAKYLLAARSHVKKFYPFLPYLRDLNSVFEIGVGAGHLFRLLKDAYDIDMLGCDIELDRTVVYREIRNALGISKSVLEFPVRARKPLPLNAETEGVIGFWTAFNNTWTVDDHRWFMDYCRDTLVGKKRVVFRFNRQGFTDNLEVARYYMDIGEFPISPPLLDAKTPQVHTDNFCVVHL